MTENYTPEIGQACFGQPYKRYKCPLYLTSHLETVSYELDRMMRNLNQAEYNNPFCNTGSTYKNDVFEVEAYSWNYDDEQKYNFKWRDIEVSWYKHLGRGDSVNREVSPDEASELLSECLQSLSEAP